MVNREQLISVTENLNQIPKAILICHDIVFALIENNEAIFSGSVLGFLSPNEYDRAREVVISKCVSAVRELKNVRRSILSPDAIRATTFLNHVEKSCRTCQAKNKRRMAEGKSFCCLAIDSEGGKSQLKFHFRLNNKEGIVAQFWESQLIIKK